MDYTNNYPLTINVIRLWACLYWKSAISNDNIFIIIIIILAQTYIDGIYDKKYSIYIVNAALYQYIVIMLSHFP